MNSVNLKSSASKHESSAIAQLRRGRILLGALICTLIANILCLPLWTDYDVAGFVRTPLNKEARVDIIYTGPLTGAEAFSITSAEPSLSALTNYRYGTNSQLYTANLHVEREWEAHNLTLRAHRKGNIEVRVKGPYQ